MFCDAACATANAQFLLSASYGPTESTLSALGQTTHQAWVQDREAKPADPNALSTAHTAAIPIKQLPILIREGSICLPLFFPLSAAARPARARTHGFAAYGAESHGVSRCQTIWSTSPRACGARDAITCCQWASWCMNQRACGSWVHEPAGAAWDGFACCNWCTIPRACGP